MKRQLRQDKKPKSPYVRKPYLVSCYGFKRSGILFAIPYKKGHHVQIILNHHTIQVLDSDPQIKIKSFVVTPDLLSITIKKDIKPITPTNVIGIDRNLRNVTAATPNGIIQYRTEKLLSIKKNSIFARAGFKRNDRRIKARFYQKIKTRQTRRVNQYLHKISKDIVHKAKQTNSAIIFENLNGIRKLYRKGNGQGKKYRLMMNSWSFYELLRQI